jgi:hypothetical protein
MTELIFFGMLAFPFIFVAALSRELAKMRCDLRYGWGLFLPTILLLGWNYLSGKSSSDALLDERKWTAASLVWGVVVLRSVPIVLVCWVLKARLCQGMSINREDGRSPVD